MLTDFSSKSLFRLRSLAKYGRTWPNSKASNKSYNRWSKMWQQNKWILSSWRTSWLSDRRDLVRHPLSITVVMYPFQRWQNLYSHKQRESRQFLCYHLASGCSTHLDLMIRPISQIPVSCQWFCTKSWPRPLHASSTQLSLSKALKRTGTPQ